MRNPVFGAVAAAAISLWSGSAVAQAYTHSAVAIVGYVQASGARGGVTVWRQKNNAAFPACTSDPTQMWISSAVTEEAGKSMLAILLSAKATETTVVVHYVVESSGYCSMTHLAVS